MPTVSQQFSPFLNFIEVSGFFHLIKYFVLLCFVFRLCYFQDRFSLYDNPSCPVDQAGFQLIEICLPLPFM